MALTKARLLKHNFPVHGGGFQKGGFGGCSPGTKTGTRARSPKPPFYETALLSPSEPLFGVDKRVVSKRVVSADVPPERKPERGYVRQNHLFTKPPFHLPVIFCCTKMGDRFLSSAGAGGNCGRPMRLPDPSPVLDKSRASMGPEILSTTGAGVWHFSGNIMGTLKGRPLWHRWSKVSVATPAEPRGGKKTFFVQIWAVKNSLKFVEKCR